MERKWPSCACCPLLHGMPSCREFVLFYRGGGVGGALAEGSLGWGVSGFALVLKGPGGATNTMGKLSSSGSARASS